MAKLARTSTAAVYECRHDWPDDCFVQCGANGVVFAGANSYQTAFFEAFPQDLKAFLRGEGKTIEAAEERCWQQYQKALACPGHEFERRGYRNGLGFCKHCDLAQPVFEPSETCVVCGKPTYHTYDVDNNWYCEEHAEQMPEEKWPALRVWFKKMLAEESKSNG